MAATVKDIGYRQAYDILQRRKPRTACADYGHFGFRPILRRVPRFVTYRSAGRNPAFANEVQSSWCPGPALEIGTGAIGEVASASGNAARTQGFRIAVRSSRAA